MICISAKMDVHVGVEFDAEYNGADRFVENCVESAHFGSFWGLKWAFVTFWLDINVHEIIFFLHKKSTCMSLLYLSTNYNYTIIKWPVFWPQRGHRPLSIFA